MGRLAMSLLSIHAQLAKQELSRDQSRLVRGLVLLIIGALLLATVIVLLQVLGITLLQRVGLSWPVAVLVTAGVDLLLGAVLVLAGVGALKQPVLPETREKLKRTLSALSS
jgi:hypothetical protein